MACRGLLWQRRGPRSHLLDVPVSVRPLALLVVLLAARAGADCQLGDFAVGSIVDCNFTTQTSIPATLGGTPALSIQCGNTASFSTTGVTLTPDFVSITGLNHVRVDTASYSTGQECQMVITAGTVGGASVVGSVVGGFSLNHESALRPATAGRTAAIDASGRVDLGAVLGTASQGTAGYVAPDWGHVNAPTSTVGLSGTTIGTLTSNSDKTGYSLTVTPPTAAQIVAATWDEPLAGHTTAGTTGKKLSDIPISSSSLTAAQVWDYQTSSWVTSGSAGAFLLSKLSLLTAGAITVAGPVAANQDIDIAPGTAYMSSPHSHAITFGPIASPDLTNATPKLVITSGKVAVVSVTGSVTAAGTVAQIVTFELTAVQTALLTRIGDSSYQHQVSATWSTDTPAQPWILITGTVNTGPLFH